MTQIQQQSQLKRLELELSVLKRRQMPISPISFKDRLHDFFIICYPALKRMLDIAVSLSMLIALSPILIIVSVIIKFQDGGNVIYYSTRVGTRGKYFRFPKFRSMKLNADSLLDHLKKDNQHGKDGVTFKMKKDPRITGFGRIMRRFSMDELPQLWCVLKGEMSLVGPRPPIPSEVDQYKLSEMHRFDVKPGLTCFWQVMGRAEIPFEGQVELDLKYVRERSFYLDLKLLMMTIPAILYGKGAY